MRGLRPAVLLSVLLLPATPLAAQSGIGVGVEFGYTRADLDGSDAKRAEFRSGAIAGVFLDLHLTSALSFTFGPTLAAQGGFAPLAAGPYDGLAVDLVSIELPLMIRTRLALGTFGLLIEAGGMPGIRIGCNIEVQQGPVPSFRTPCNDPALAGVATFSLWDMAVIGGIGVGIPVAGSEVGLKLRISRGFIPVIESRDVYNRSFSIMLALPF